MGPCVRRDDIEMLSRGRHRVWHLLPSPPRRVRNCAPSGDDSEIMHYKVLPLMRGALMARVLFLLPARDFDPGEAAVSWRVLVNAGHVVSFATPDGRSATADDMMLTGKGLDPWGAIPLLRNLPLVGLCLRANPDPRKAHLE